MTQQYLVRHLRLGDSAVTQSTLTAQSEQEVRQQLESQSHAVLSIQPMRPQGERMSWGLGPRRAAPSFALFCRELRTLIQAGMTVVEAADTLSARERLEGARDSLAARLLAKLQQGMSLSAAMSDLPGAPAVLIAAVRAGERTSNLAEALDDYLRFDTLVTQLRKKVISASIYPALVTLIGLSISIFLLLVVMPNFASMYENLRGDSAGGLAFTIEMSRFLGSHRLGVFLALGASALGLVFWISSGLAKRHLTAWAFAIPWMRARIEDFQLAMMYQALALLLKGGYPMTAAMQVAGQSALSAQLKAQLARASNTIEHGGLVSQALAKEGLCDEVGRRLMAAAERNGNFHIATQVVSRLHGERFELFVERVTRIVEPILLLAVALVVGGIVVMMYLPVFDMATQLR